MGTSWTCCTPVSSIERGDGHNSLLGSRTPARCFGGPTLHRAALDSASTLIDLDMHARPVPVPVPGPSMSLLLDHGALV